MSHTSHTLSSPRQRVITLANRKGGVGKTSCAVNLAALTAEAGMRTLLIDLDPQGNVGHDLGYGWKGQSDDGRGLLAAIVARQPITPLTGVRPNLDVICGGDALREVDDVITGRARRDGDESLTALADILDPITGNYDIIFIDTPPTNENLLQLALRASRWVIIPSRSDRSSIDGLSRLAQQMTRARTTNPDLSTLGAVLFASSTNATTVRKNALDDIAASLNGSAPVFRTVIRHVESPAAETRERGLVAHELAGENENAEPFYLALRKGETPQRVSRTASTLADDYKALAQEVTQALREHEKDMVATS